MNPEIIACTVPTAVKISGIGRSRLYELLKSKDIVAIKQGSRTLILMDSLREYINTLPRAVI